MKNKFKKTKTKNILTLVSILLIMAVVIGLCVNMGNLQTTKKVGLTDYSIGQINTTTGANVDSSKSIRMNNKETVDGLSIKLKENAQITYKVVFYDEDKAFDSITASQSTDFAVANIPATAEYFRVVITPNQVDGEDVTINLLNMSAYASQITITFDK